MEKRKNFLINFAYFAIIIMLAVLFFKYGFRYVMPVCIGFLIAYLLNAPIKWLCEKTPISRKLCAFITITLVIGLLALVIVLLAVNLADSVRSILTSLPTIYKHKVEPYVFQFLDWYEKLDFVELLGSTAGGALETAVSSAMSSVGSYVTGFSVKAVSWLTTMLSNFPSFLTTFLITIISAYFVAFDYDELVCFVRRQLDEKTLVFLSHFKQNFVDTIFKYLVSYIVILLITFGELALLFTIAGIMSPVVVASIVALFDIMPIVGVSTVLIPWIILDLLSGAYTQAIILILGWLAITVIRNVIEPKIVGNRVGLHPVLTLVCLYAGLKLAGILGMFALPITMVCLIEMQKAGIIKLYK